MSRMNLTNRICSANLTLHAALPLYICTMNMQRCAGDQIECTIIIIVIIITLPFMWGSFSLAPIIVAIMWCCYIDASMADTTPLGEKLPERSNDEIFYARGYKINIIGRWITMYLVSWLAISCTMNFIHVCISHHFH